MNRGIITAVLLAGVLAFNSAQALYLDKEQSIQVTGKVFTQASLRMTGSDSEGVSCYPFGADCEGFTFPNTKTGQLIQHRNLLDLEMYHNVKRWLGPQFTLLDQLGYRLRVKWFYDGVYDYGPEGYSHAASALNANSVPALAQLLQQGLLKNRDLDTQKDPLWNAYVDVAKGPVKVRVGRQDLSWGETDGFRLLDMIEPLDNRFGFPLVEDLDDRRIPLWMVRPTVSLGTIGPLRNLTIDGYWVPGTIDDTISPVAPFGNPFGVGAPPGPSTTFKPVKNLGNSRGGGRLIGTVGDVTFSIAHYVTYNDYPSQRLAVNGINVAPIPTADAPYFFYFSPDAQFLVEYYQQQITGGTATFALPFDPYTIIRMEVANFWDERMFIPQQSVDSAVAACAAQNPSTGGVGPCSETRGSLPTKNVMRWMLGFDRNVWIRWLNPENTFYFSGQYFHTNIMNYQPDIANGVPSNTHLVPIGQVPIGDDISLPLESTIFDWVPRNQDEITVTYLINTLLWHGNIQPQIFGAYDWRGVHAVVPSISYQYGTNLVFTIKYSVIRGTYANLGFFRDRDQLLFRVQYNMS